MRKNLWTALAVTAVAAIISAVPAAAADSDVISDGVYIGDQDVGGMTTKEAEQYVKGQVRVLEQTTVTIQMGEQQSTKTLKELGLKWDNPDLVQEISQIGTTGNIIRRYKEQKSLQNENSRYEIEYTVDSSLEEAFVDSCNAYNSDPVEGSVYMGDDGQLHVEGGTDGLTLDAEATLKEVQAAIGEWKAEDITIEATVEVESPQVTAETLSKMTDVLGTATTDYSASSSGRAQNVENGTSKINGTLPMPGESFSVTDAVVPFKNAENGYELAPSYEAGQGRRFLRWRYLVRCPRPYTMRCSRQSLRLMPVRTTRCSSAMWIRPRMRRSQRVSWILYLRMTRTARSTLRGRHIMGH